MSPGVPLKSGVLGVPARLRAAERGRAAPAAGMPPQEVVRLARGHQAEHPPLAEGNRDAVGVTARGRVPGPEVALVRAALLTEPPAPYAFHEGRHPVMEAATRAGGFGSVGWRPITAAPADGQHGPPHARLPCRLGALHSAPPGRVAPAVGLVHPGCRGPAARAIRRDDTEHPNCHTA